MSSFSSILFIVIVVSSLLAADNNVVTGFSLLSSSSSSSKTTRTRTTSIKTKVMKTIMATTANDDDITNENKNYINSSRRDVMKSAMTAAASSAMMFTTICAATPKAAYGAYIDANDALPKITKRVYLDIKIGNDDDNKPTGRIIIGLFGDLMPKVTENFEKLCDTNNNNNGLGYSYKGSTFYRIISDLSIQGGEINDKTGRSGLSAFGPNGSNGKTFEPDNYNLQHNKKGLVSMVRNIDGSVDSRFFIQIQNDAGWADDRYAAFGIIDNDDGLELISKINNLDVKRPQNNPKVDVTIVDCGVL